MKNIYAAFVRAQTGFAPALKSSTNPHFKSKYADLAAVVEAVIDSLNAHDIGLVQKTHLDESGVTVETVLVHGASGEAMDCGKLHVPAAKQDPQGYGSALTYARRYSLMAACGIAPEDDDGNAAAKPVKTQPGKIEGPRGVAGAVLAGAAALGKEREGELSYLAGNVAKAYEKKGAKWCAEQLEGEALTDVELIYLSTLLPSAVRNGINDARRGINQAAVA